LQRGYGPDPVDLHNIIDDRRHLRARTSYHQWHSPIRAPTPSERGAFCALAPEFRQVT
jgi:hypothetical protein